MPSQNHCGNPAGGGGCPALMTRLDENDGFGRVNALLREVLPENAFQRGRLGARLRIERLEDFLDLPFQTKDQLVADAEAHPPFGTNLTYPLERYLHYHQTSGTTGRPLRVLDDRESWAWWGRCWLKVFQAAGVTPADRLFFAFSFAPSIGFWSSYKSAEMLGAMAISGGGAGTEQRLRMILDTKATVLLSTPSYALRMAEVARRRGIAIRDSNVHTLIHAGEPGASLAHTRRQLEEAWAARVVDHAGATEVGAWGVGTREGGGLVVNEEEFVAEVLDPKTLEPVAPGDQGELVLTALGRAAWPVIRYRTGDIVKGLRQPLCDGTTRLYLEGGVLGRADDMLTIRGMNLYPSRLENLIRQSGGACEFRTTAVRRDRMDALEIEVEAKEDVCRQIADSIREQMGIRVAVKPVPPGSLPRWEGKNQRFQDKRGHGEGSSGR